MRNPCFARRLEICAGHMREMGLEALLLTKPANMSYLTDEPPIRT
jgi:hypothetical protein